MFHIHQEDVFPTPLTAGEALVPSPPSHPLESPAKLSQEIQEEVATSFKTLETSLDQVLDDIRSSLYSSAGEEQMDSAAPSFEPPFPALSAPPGRPPFEVIQRLVELSEPSDPTLSPDSEPAGGPPLRSPLSDGEGDTKSVSTALLESRRDSSPPHYGGHPLQAAPADIISVLNDAPHRQEQREIEHLQEQNKFLRKTLRQVRNHCEQLTAGNKERNEHFAVQFNKMRQISEEMEETHARELSLKDEDLLQQRITMEAGFRQRLEDQKVAQDKEFRLEKLGLQEEINRRQSQCEVTLQEKQAVTSMWQETKNRLRKYEAVDEVEGDNRKLNMGGSCIGPQPIRVGEPSTGRKFASGFKKMFFN